MERAIVRACRQHCCTSARHDRCAGARRLRKSTQQNTQVADRGRPHFGRFVLLSFREMDPPTTNEYIWRFGHFLRSRAHAGGLNTSLRVPTVHTNSQEPPE